MPSYLQILTVLPTMILCTPLFTFVIERTYYFGKKCFAPQRLEAKDTEKEEKQSGIHKVVRFMIKCAKIAHVRCAA